MSQQIDFKKDNPNNLPVLSFSKITTFKRCPKSYKFGYIDKLPKLDKPYTVFGTFCHDILQSFHEYYLDKTIEHLPYKDIMQVSFKKSIEKFKIKLTKDQVDEAYIMMKLYLSQIEALGKINKYPNIIGVEKTIWQIVNDFIFYGFIDRVQEDEDKMIHVIDYKTTSKKIYLKDPTQILLYGYFMWLENPDIKRIRTSYILLKHKMEYMTHEHDVSELVAAKDGFVESWEQLKKEKLFRAVPHYGNCTICDFTAHCQEGGSLMQRKKGFYGEETSW